ncbi:MULTISPECIES: ABC transporter substrate-binding protein [unclassified Agarivorans]|uniref:ABC transporter substrate-binding protein n=1 Tax=unclassified Agarivorans TaxID=2636026 RepID=UPI0026E401E2|nr:MULTISPECIES: extracellular solute-binding protein [unclassified Agarivorans]MDO6684144.1 extracellular solute-binding protein [Agarivorans sp. 3_MG-2023]MDO6714122.1 extracellular solute-binding protein [Agarivorans sp. 2_MG-2023]
MFHKPIAFIALLCSLVSLPSWADIELNILCWEGYAPADRVKQFEQYIADKYKQKLTINVEYAVEDKQWFEVIRAKKADIISPTHNIPKSTTWPMVQFGLLLPINLNNIPNYQRLNPHLVLEEYVLHQQQTFAVPLVYGPYGLAYNTEKVTIPPTSWNVLWDPQYTNQYTVSEVFYEVNIYLTALALGYPASQLQDYEAFSKDKQFIAKLSELAGNANKLWGGIDTAEDLKGLSLATSFGFAFSELEKQGEKWTFATPKEGQTAWVDHWAIGYSLKDSPLKKQIAEEWINFTISEELQREYAQKLSSFPVISQFDSALSSQEIERYQLNNPNFFQEQFFLLKFIDRRQQNGFRKLWEQAKLSH